MCPGVPQSLPTSGGRVLTLWLSRNLAAGNRAESGVCSEWLCYEHPLLQTLPYWPFMPLIATNIQPQRETRIFLACRNSPSDLADPLRVGRAVKGAAVLARSAKSKPNQLEATGKSTARAGVPGSPLVTVNLAGTGAALCTCRATMPMSLMPPSSREATRCFAILGGGPPLPDDRVVVCFPSGHQPAAGVTPMRRED